ncbi:MAG: TldD/PmbA family protein [Candidatus Bathyarchaeia archaeon]|nr:TldD/PmbA family protein [Candidatus Bathyarchaeota archaeon]
MERAGDLEDLGELVIKTLSRSEVKYGEARLCVEKAQTFSVNTGELEPVSLIVGKGIGIRALVKGSLGFASTNILERSAVREAALESVKLAEASSRRNKTPISLSNEDICEERWRTMVKEDPLNVSMEDKISLLQDLDGIASSENCPKRVLSISESTESRLLITTEGVKVSGEAVRVSFTGLLTAITSASSAQRIIQKGETAGWEAVAHWRLPDLIKEEAKSLSEVAECTKSSPTGLMDLILGPEVVGIICHEACGHPQEADRILGREAAQAGESYITPEMRGFKIGSDAVTIIDDPTLKGGFGSYPFDDEGVKARPRILIEEGRINEFLHNRETAPLFGCRSNASARAMGYDREPIIRMANTYMKPGGYSFEELVEEVDEGVFIKSFMEWNIDDRRWNQRYVGLEAFRIRKGEVEERIRDPVLEITTDNLFKSVDAASKELKFEAAICGKGDPMQGAPVWHGGPTIRLRGVKLSRR